MKAKNLLYLIVMLFTTFVSKAQDSISVYDLSLEELMKLQVTSVSKQAESIQDVPAAIYVITSKDIKHSGATTLAELLRLKVPGYWSVSYEYDNTSAYIRNNYSGSVLVLLDGTPMQDLVQSDFKYGNFDIPLNQIEQIEIIRGSGGTVYGANAATGVISIMTKNPDNNSWASLDGGMPAYGSVSAGTGVKLNEKTALSVYGRTRYFSGYDQMSVTDGTSHTVQSSYNNNDTTFTNRFTGDDNTKTMSSGGFSLKIKASEKLTISSTLHFNAAHSKKYFTYYPESSNMLVGLADNPQTPRPVQTKDSLLFLNNNSTRLVAQVKGEYSISSSHNIFAKVSTNREKYRYAISAGVESMNSTYDFEIQDNITLGNNHLSIGANHRLLNYDLSNVQVPSTISFVKPINTESLTGFFAQDKLSFLDEKLILIAGIKAENFSLIDKKYYLSPMAKVIVKPTDKTMLWLGYTKAYTTPGYIQTNVEFRLFRANSPDVFYNFAKPLVQYQIFEQTKAAYIQGGLDEATAAGKAQAFLGSPAGMYVTDSVTKMQISADAAKYPGHFNVSAVNGNKTVPTAISSVELGWRTQPASSISWEGNIYYSQIDGGVINSPSAAVVIPSKTQPGEYTQAYFYGNYLKGSVQGVENIVKVYPTKSVSLEFSHTYTNYSTEYKTNNDFDITLLTDAQRTLKRNYPTIPKNVFRLNVSLDLPGNWYISSGLVYATKFRNSFGTVDDYYQYDNQRLEPLVGDIATNKTSVGAVDSRLIVNLKIEKELMNNKLNVYVYANDLTTKSKVESVSVLSAVYPRQVSGLYGIGLNYNF